MKAELILLSSMALLGLPLPKAASSVTHLDWEYTVFPCFKGESGLISCLINTNRFPGFYAYVGHMEGDELILDEVNSYPDIHGTLDYSLQIPKEVTEKGSFDIQFGFSQVYPGSSSPSAYEGTAFVHVSCAERYEYKKVNQDSILSPNRTTYAFDYRDPSKMRSIKEHYSFEGIDSEDSSASRRFPFTAYRFKCLYDSLYQMAGGANFAAELRILDNIEDFEGLGEVVGGYRSIPLTVHEDYRTEDEISYSFLLKDWVYYSRKDYQITESTLYSFSSKNLYLPLRQGHDSDTCRFQVVLKNVSVSRDSFIIEDSVTFPRRFFGEVGEAEYGVVIGGKDDA